MSIPVVGLGLHAATIALHQMPIMARGSGVKRDTDDLGEDRVEVLRLVEEGVISPDEALELMEGLEEATKVSKKSSPGMLDRLTATFLKGSELAGESGSGESEPAARPQSQRRRHLHLIVNDGERNKVDIVLPITLIDTGWNLIERFIPDAFDRQAAGAIRNALLNGSSGTIVEIKDGTQLIKVSLE